MMNGINSLNALLEKMGNFIKNKRIASELSQEELSNLSGVSIASIARFENGRGNISLTNLILITQALGMSDQLMSIFKMDSPSPLLMAKAHRKKIKERVRKSKKSKVSSTIEWKWGDDR